jgi:hypothetical protein
MRRMMTEEKISIKMIKKRMRMVLMMISTDLLFMEMKTKLEKRRKA